MKVYDEFDNIDDIDTDYIKHSRNNENPFLTKILKSIALTIIITVGVTAGNLASNAITAYYAAHQAAKLTKAAAEELRRLNERNAFERQQQAEQRQRQRLIQQQRQREAKKQREQQSAADKQRTETCNFWIAEYRKTKRELDKIHRDTSCRAAGRSGY